MLKLFESTTLYKRELKYLGSIAVTQLNINDQQTFITEQFDEMEKVVKGLHVILTINNDCIKVFKENETTVKICHNFPNVLSCICLPVKKMFAYIARARTSDGRKVIQGHIFKTKRSSHVKEINSKISKVFTMDKRRNTINRKIMLECQEDANKENTLERVTVEQMRSGNIKRKRWAKEEIARGHQYAFHAQQAQKKNLYSAEDVNTPNDLNKEKKGNCINEVDIRHIIIKSEDLIDGVENFDIDKNVSAIKFDLDPDHNISSIEDQNLDQTHKTNKMLDDNDDGWLVTDCNQIIDNSFLFLFTNDDADSIDSSDEANEEITDRNLTKKIEKLIKKENSNFLSIDTDNNKESNSIDETNTQIKNHFDTNGNNDKDENHEKDLELDLESTFEDEGSDSFSNDTKLSLNDSDTKTPTVHMEDPNQLDIICKEILDDLIDSLLINAVMNDEHEKNI